MIALWMTLVVGASPRLPATVSWVGNTFPGAAKWVQQDIAGMCVLPDGSVYTNIFWEEAGGNVGLYRDGDCLGFARHTHGWGYEGGDAVAANSKYVFIAQSADNEGGGLKDPDTWPEKGRGWCGVSRRQRADFTKPAPFEGGKGGKGDTLRGAFLVVEDFPEAEKARIAGLLATETRLMISSPRAGAILLHDAETMARVGRIECPQPGPLALDGAGRLWVLRGTQPASLASFDGQGRPGATYTFAPDAKPSGLCHDRGRLLVADRGPSQQIIIVGGLDGQPREVGRFGVRGGVYAAPAGRVGPARFNMPSAVGVDGRSRIYVANDGHSGGGGTVLQCYEADGKLVWELHGLTFVDVAAADPVNDADVFTKEERFRLDYGKPAGREWSYAGYTIDPFAYPDDPRLHLWSGGVWVRRIEGRRFLFVLDMNAEWLQVYRFEAARGETAIPSGLFAKRPIRDKGGWPAHQPERGEWIWRDADGNGAFDAGEYVSAERDLPASQGWWVDAKGNVWQALENDGVRCLPYRGLDAKGNPTWDLAAARTWPKPAEFAQLKRLRYDAVTDTLILGGTTAEHRNQHWKPMGPYMACYDKWSSGTPTRRWTLTAPYEQGSSGHSSCEPMGFDTAGDYLFVPYTGASKAMGFRHGHIEVFRLTDATPVGHLEPSNEVGEIGLQDLRETMSVHRRADGEYLVFLEDDYKAKTVMYRWRP